MDQSRDAPEVRLKNKSYSSLIDSLFFGVFGPAVILDEALDCLVYAMAAGRRLRLHTWGPAEWDAALATIAW